MKQEGKLAQEQIDLRRRHLPALDGLRAVAVGAVMLYHLDLGWAGGGYLGVDLFFVLSGFLITGLLLEERSSSGRISLRRFWARRARRLFPALLLMLGAVSLYAILGGSGLNRVTLRGDTVATLLYVANWHFIVTNSSYFAQFAAPSPLEHTWSLAIEEQFYVLWPILLLVFAKLGGSRWRRVTVVGTAVLAVASVLDMAFLAHGASDLTRAYFGTDTRVFELMVGALLALWVEGSDRILQIAPAVLHRAGIVAACAIVAGFRLLGGPPRWMFDGGFLGVALLAVVVIASVTNPAGGSLGAILSLRPLRWVGKISYGLYLWHWPVFVVFTAASTGLADWAVDVSRVALTFTLATLSFYLVEQPIRRRVHVGMRHALALGVSACTAAAIALALVIVPAGIVVAGAPPAFAIEGGHVFSLARVPTRKRPIRVLLIGDSVLQFAAPGIFAALRSTGVVTTVSIAMPGWGLTKIPLWSENLRGAIARDKPDVVMGTWSWDAQDAATHAAAYRKLLDEALGVILTPGDGVQGMVFLQFPAVAAARPSVNRDLAIWNDVVASEATDQPKSIGYLPVASSLESRGHLAVWLPDAAGQLVRVRSTDDVHLCPSGTARYAAAILSELEVSWKLPVPTTKWWTRPWVRSPLYGSGRCPNDQPASA